MICQKCHKNLATIRYAEVVNGRVSDRMICPSCYKAMEQGETSGFEIAGQAPTPRRMRPSAATVDQMAVQKSCRACGKDLEEVLESRMAGCSVCYDSFGEEIAPVLQETHYGTLHRGKAPHVDTDREALRNELRNKRALLRSALNTENYEEAAQLRDVIRDLEENLSASSAKRE